MLPVLQGAGDRGDSAASHSLRGPGARQLVACQNPSFLTPLPPWQPTTL